MLQAWWNMWANCNGTYCFVWRRQGFYHLPSQTWKLCSYRFCAEIPFSVLWVYPGDAKQGSYLSLFLKCQSHFLPTLSSLKAWTSGFAEPFSSSYSLQFLLIMLSALPWATTFYSRPVLTLHINSLPPLLKRCFTQFPGSQSTSSPCL